MIVEPDSAPQTVEMPRRRLSLQIPKTYGQLVDKAENKPQQVEEMGKVKRFFKKYFLEGQKLEASQQEKRDNIDPNAPWHEKLLTVHRQWVAIGIPYLFYNTIWWCLAIKHNFFKNFPTHYPMSITMIVGSAIGGATSEGGGAVAFPVMTLALHIAPSIARDFSMMVQSCGMVSASFAILFMKIRVEWHSVIFCSIGAFFGLIFGLEVIDNLLSNPVKKLCFVSIWFSFCVALFLLNREHKRTTYDSIPHFNKWHAMILVFTGFLGGIFTATCGSGTDICSFSVLSLLFRISEKVSTPTSVILMAINTVTGMCWRQFMTYTGAEPEAWKYLSVAVPFATAAGPIGAYLASYCHRQVLAAFIYILDTVALITAICVIPMTWQYWVLVVALILGGGVIFFILAKLGERLLVKNQLKDIQMNHTKQMQGYDNKVAISMAD